MAKKREVTIGKFNITEQGCELQARVGFSLKMFDGDQPIEHVMGIDMSMTKDQLIHLAISTIVIDAQKIMRGLESHAKVREFTGKILGYKDIYPGVRRVSVTKDMSPADIRAKAKSDPAFRKSLMDELMALEDEDVVEE